MRIVYFTHSLASCWNHGNAHFLRGVLSELIARGHDVRVFAPENSWSLTNLVADHGAEALDAYRSALGLGHPQPTLLHEAIGDLHTLQGEYAAALAAYEAAAALGDARRVLNVGAGTGSYEPVDR